MLVIHRDAEIQVIEAENLTALAVRSSDPGSLSRALEPIDSSLEENHVWLNIEWLRSNSDVPHSDAKWQEKFEGMIRFAAKSGWTNADETHVRAHIEATS